MDIKEMSEEERFKACLKDAYDSVHSDIFRPELDNLAKQDIDSILFKVLVERDMLEEGYIERLNPDSIIGKAWLKRSKDFILKWSDYVKNPEDRACYEEFKNE